MTTRRPCSLLAICVVAALYAARVPSVRADDGGPVVIGERQHPSVLSLDPIHGSLGFVGMYQSQSTSTAGHTDSNTNTLFTESLTLNTAGRVVSNNLFTWTGTGTVLLEEQNSNGSGGKDSQLGVFDTFDFESLIFGKTQYPVTAYARRSENIIDRAFAAPLRGVNTSYGATFRYDSPIVPSSLSIGHTTTTQSDIIGDVQYSTDVNQVQASTLIQAFDRHQISLDYSYTNTSQNNPGLLKNNSEAQEATIGHTWSIDADGRFVLSEGAGYSSETGQFATTRSNFAEGLRAKWSDTLDSSLNYRFDKTSDTTGDRTQQNINANITHRLFESLTTTANANASLSNSNYANPEQGSFSSKTYGLSIGENYVKRVSWNGIDGWGAGAGRFNASLSLGYTQNDNGPVGTTQQVLGDVQSFTDPQPIILTRTGVNGNSIAVFDATGMRRFVSGLDYTVRTVGNTVQIQRVVGGNIGDGDTVRLNYQIDPLPGYTSRLTNFNGGLGFTFEEGGLKGLTLFTRYAQTDQTISPSTAQVRADNIRDVLFGAEYHVWKVSLRAEDEIHDSTLSAYDALRLSARYTDRISDRSTLSLSASQNFINYPMEHTRSDLTTVDGRLDYQIMQDLRASVSARWRYENDSDLGNSMGFEETGELRWRVRQTDVTLQVRHTDLEARGTSADSLLFQLGISRNF